MGWKNVKEHYRIDHIVCVADDMLYIGSPYVHDLIVIAMDGTVIKRYQDGGNDNLRRYMREFDAAPNTLRQLIQLPDSFSDSIAVYTFAGAEITTKACELPGFPNVTHDGELMYDNTFSTDKAEVVEWAKQAAAAGARLAKLRAEEYRTKLAEAESLMKECLGDLAALGWMANEDL